MTLKSEQDNIVIIAIIGMIHFLRSNFSLLIKNFSSIFIKSFQFTFGVSAYKNYVGAPLEKAKAGRIVVKGNYIALIIAGDDTVVEEKGVDVAYSYIDELLKRIFDK